MTERIILKGSKKLLMPAITELMAMHQLLEQKDIGAFYGKPAELYHQETLEFKPQVTLEFFEDDQDVAPGYRKTKGEINFRIAGETNETISEGNLRSIGTQIKSVFGSNNGYVWRKGKIKCNYADRKNGYHFQMLTRNESVGKDLITKVLRVQNHTPEWKNLNISENQEPQTAYPTIAPTKQLLAKPRRMPRRRPIADVRFRRAVAYIYGLPNPIILYSLEGRSSNALVT